jgi:hypothetical protein
MNKHHTHVTHARALLADIVGAPDVYLPRREILTDWLRNFVGRAQVSSYELGDTEADDLGALERFVRGKKVPVAAAAT